MGSPSYSTVEELRAEMNLDGTGDDATLERLLNAAERKINNLCNRPDGFVADTSASARYYEGSGKAWQRIHECVAVSAVAVKDAVSDDEDSYTSWTIGVVGTTTEADCFPARGHPKRPDFTLPAACGKPFTLLVMGISGDYSTFIGGEWSHRPGFRPLSQYETGTPTVQVTARWGYSATVPDDIKTATIMQAARWYKRLQSAMADSVAGPDMGQLFYRQTLDPDIKGILSDGRYIKPSIG